MLRQGLVLTAILVGTYLLVAHATDAGKLISAGSSAYNTGVKTLQGR